MKSGFVSLIGRTNAGKSSLVNYLLSEKIAMVSHKQNATRRKINAIVMHGDDQIIFTDTPGLNSGNKIMNKAMNENALGALKDCDLALFVADTFDNLSTYAEFAARKIPHIIALTKIDLVSKEQIFKKLGEYQKFASEFKAIIPLSVKKSAYKKILLDEICKHLPEHEYFYDPEFITTTAQKDIYKDFILEAIFKNVSDEIPYSTDVVIKKVVERENLTEIYAQIITDNEHRKVILISAIKRIGITARKLINTLSESKIYLKLDVKVVKNWTSDAKEIKKFIF